jgi:hypothetical protein
VLLPDKPVKSLTLHCLFRGHTGKVWFDDASLEEVPTPAGAVLFQGVPLQEITQANAGPKASPRRLSTRDGLKLTLRDNTERPITVTMGTNTLVGRDASAISEAADQALTQPPRVSTPPLWDGRAGKRIAEVLIDDRRARS